MRAKVINLVQTKSLNSALLYLLQGLLKNLNERLQETKPTTQPTAYRNIPRPQIFHFSKLNCVLVVLILHHHHHPLFKNHSTDKLGRYGRIPFQPFLRALSQSFAFAIALLLSLGPKVPNYGRAKVHLPSATIFILRAG